MHYTYMCTIYSTSTLTLSSFKISVMEQGSKIWIIGLAGIGSLAAGCALCVITVTDKLAEWRGKDELIVFTAPQIVSHYKRHGSLCKDLKNSAGNLSHVMIKGYVSGTSPNNDHESSLSKKCLGGEFDRGCAPLQLLLSSVPFILKDKVGSGNEIATVQIKENELPISHLHSAMKLRDDIYQLTYDTQIALIGSAERMGNGGDIIFYPQEIMKVESKKGIKLSTIVYTVLIIAGLSCIAAVAIKWWMKNKRHGNNAHQQPIQEDNEQQD